VIDVVSQFCEREMRPSSASTGSLLLIEGIAQCTVGDQRGFAKPRELPSLEGESYSDIGLRLVSRKKRV